MLPHVDSFRPAHNLASLEQLAAVISRPDDSGEKLRLLGAADDESLSLAAELDAYRTARTRGANLMALSQPKNLRER